MAINKGKLKKKLSNDEQLQKVVAAFNESPIDLITRRNYFFSRRTIMNELFEFRVCLKYADVSSQIAPNIDDKEKASKINDQYDSAVRVKIVPTPMSMVPGEASKRTKSKYSSTSKNYGPNKYDGRGLVSGWWRKGKRLKNSFEHSIVFDGDTAKWVGEDIYYNNIDMLQRIDSKGKPYWMRMEERGFFFFPFSNGHPVDTDLSELHTTGHNNPPDIEWDTSDITHPEIRHQIATMELDENDDGRIGLVERNEDSEVIGYWNEYEFYGQSHPKYASKKDKEYSTQFPVVRGLREHAQDVFDVENDEQAREVVKSRGGGRFAWDAETGKLIFFKSKKKQTRKLKDIHSASVDTTPFGVHA